MTAIKTSLKASLIATAIATLPLGAHAAGLGSLNVFSGLGQPLRAEIELNATPQELESLTARIASSEAFRQANLPYSSVMTSLRLAVERRGGGAVVRISSDRPLNEPFVDLLLELDWAAGRLIREYTFLLDPVPLNAPAPVAAQVTAPNVSSAASGRPGPAAAASARAPAASQDRYEVRRGDTLRGVAEAHRPESASLDQMLIALFRDNPEAFDGGNMNRLRAGAILNVPAEPTVLSVEPVQARREVMAQSEDFEAYRRRLAGAAASRPASSEPSSSRADAGTIVPKVEDAAQPGGNGDRVKVSAASDPAAAQSGGDGTRLARLQALEEELVARDKALEEANARLAALEASIREMQQLLELRNQGLAQLQQQARQAAGDGAATAPAGAASAPAVPPETAATDAGRADRPSAADSQPSPKPDAAARPAKPVAEPVPVEQPGLVEELLQDPKLLAGGGGILVLLLGYAGLKARRRRTAAEAGADRLDVADGLPPVTNSVFGSTGGQNVNTSDTSIIHTDFSQSGLSAIDADEGVDPVAEADVYMAYGRDAQAEEILLDALKADASRPAIFLKLLEIYEQRKNLKQFEAIASDLYSRTGGEGGDWQKAAEMGRSIDPANPLYRKAATSVGNPMTETAAPRTEPGTRPHASETAAGLAALAAVSATSQGVSGNDAEPSDTTPGDVRPDLDFTTYSTAAADASGPAQAKGKVEPLSSDSSATQIDTFDLSMTDGTGPLGAEISSAFEPVIEALPEIDSAALDFDLDAGLGLDADLPALGGTSGSSAEIDVPPVPQVAPEDGFDLDFGEVQAPAPAAEEFMSATVVGDGSELALPDQSMEFDLNADDSKALSEGMLASVDLDVAAAGSKLLSEEGDTAAADLEKTTFDSSLLDFDFNLEDADQTSADSAPAFDLSSIDLDLEPATTALDGQAEAPVEATDISTEIPLIATEELNEEALQEVDTKLELARAYDEMGDKDGARELIEEVLREGSPDQQAAGRRLLEQVG